MGRQEERRPTKLDPTDRRALEEQAAAQREQLRDIDTRDTATAEALDRGVVESRLRRTENILDRDENLIAKGVQKDRLAKRAEELERKFKEEMPTHDEMWAKPGTVEMERAVRKNQAFESKHGDEVREWKEIQNRLEPEDELVSNVERLRPR